LPAGHSFSAGVGAGVCLGGAGCVPLCVGSVGVVVVRSGGAMVVGGGPKGLVPVT